ESRPRGTVLVIVMVTLLVATAALLLFIEKASNDLLVASRDIQGQRLRREAYSALETTLAVLEDFRVVGGGLRSPAEGWGDPLGWCGYEPGEGRIVEVAFADESGKLSLPRTQFATFVELFKSWNLPQSDAEQLADALLSWMREDYEPTSAAAPRPEDYERAPLPFRPPGRSLRSFSELAAIDLVRERFFDENGNPNELWTHFTNAVSLFDFQRPNINAASPELLNALAGYDDMQQRQLSDYLQGKGAYQQKGPGYFRDAGEVATVLGVSGEVGGFGAEIRALRIMVTVHEGRTSYRLTAIVAPPGGANAVKPRKTEAETKEDTNATAASPAKVPTAGNAGATSSSALDGSEAQAKKLNYPFTLLEIRENDAIPTQPVVAVVKP
ncbi:MAG TPA: hypothetical protein VGD81_00195, partial [Opitutaceae bacterium]